jgi:hypothetical protein
MRFGILLDLINVVLWLRKTKIGLSFLLALASWFVLAPAWTFTQEGSIAFNIIAAIFKPGYFIGAHLVAVIFPLEARHTFAAALTGLACQLLVYTLFWYVVVRVVLGMRSDVPTEQEPSEWSGKD